MVGSVQKKGNGSAKIEGVRRDKKVECYPTLSIELHEQIEYLAQVRGITKTAFANELAHYCLWNHHVLDRLQPFCHFAAALNWDSKASDNTFYVWIASEDVVKDIRQYLPKPVSGKRLKFRISQEDRRRLQVMVFATDTTKADSLWSILFPLALLNPHSIYTLTSSRDVAISGVHPLTGEYIETNSGASSLVKSHILS